MVLLGQAFSEYELVERMSIPDFERGLKLLADIRPDFIRVFRQHGGDGVGGVEMPMPGEAR
jgi:hypothetical protein